MTPVEQLLKSIAAFKHHTSEAERHARGIIYYIETYFPDFEKFEEYRRVAMRHPEELS